MDFHGTSLDGTTSLFLYQININIRISPINMARMQTNAKDAIMAAKIKGFSLSSFSNLMQYVVSGDRPCHSKISNVPVDPPMTKT